MTEADDVKEKEEREHCEENKPNDKTIVDVLRNRAELLFDFSDLVSRVENSHPLLRKREQEAQKKKREYREHN